MVWDMTHYPKSNIRNPSFEVRALERQLIKQYVDQHGKLPVGNVKSEEHMDRKMMVTNRMFDTLFHD